MTVRKKLDGVENAYRSIAGELAPLRTLFPMTWPLIRDAQVDIEQTLTLARTRMETATCAYDADRHAVTAMRRVVELVGFLRAIVRACAKEGDIAESVALYPPGLDELKTE